MLKRVFVLEVLSGACGGRRRVLAVIKDPKVARRMLEPLELPAEVPRLEPALEGPRGKLWLTGPPADKFALPPAPEEFDQRCRLAAELPADGRRCSG